MNSNPSSADLRPRNALSYVKGAQVPPLLDVAIPTLLRAVARRFPYRAAAVFHSHDIIWSWAEFARKVDAFAYGLFKLGLKKGDRVGMWGPNSPEWLVTQFATARLGLVLVNINPAYRVSELEYALNKVSCRAIVTAEQFKSSNYLAMLKSLAPELAAHGFEQTALHIQNLLLGVEDKRFVFFQFGRDEALAVDERLLADVIVGDFISLRA